MISEISLSRGKAHVYFDGIRAYTVRAKDIRKADIRIGTEMDRESFVERIVPVQRADCYESALCILDVSAQTRMSMKRKLRDKGYLDAVCEETVQKLTDIGLIDEQRYTQRIVEAEKNKPSGSGSVRRKLLSKGIDRETVEEALGSLDEEQQTQACKRAIVPLLRRYRDNEPRVKRQKIAQALMRKGFSWDICASVLEELPMDDD